MAKQLKAPTAKALTLTMAMSAEGEKDLNNLKTELRLDDTGEVLLLGLSILGEIAKLNKQGYAFHLVKVTRDGQLASEQDETTNLVVFQELEHLLPDLAPMTIKEEPVKDKQIPGQMDLTDLGASV